MARFDLVWLGTACVLALVGCGSPEAPTRPGSDVPTDLPERTPTPAAAEGDADQPKTPAATGTPAQTQKPVIDPNRTYTLEVASAILSPGEGPHGAKTEWDSMAPIDPILSQQIADTLALPRQEVAIATDITNILSVANAPPDAFGSVDLLESGVVKTSKELPRIDDSFAPTWGDSRASFHGVKLTDKIRLRVHLSEYDDFSDDDTIGSVDLNLADFEGALRDGHLHHVRVTGQSDNILFIGLNVLPE